MNRLTVWAMTALLLATLAGCGGTETEAPPPEPAEPDPSEWNAEVPELTAFHDVIFELWHTAWPEKNTQMMKELLPQVEQDVAAIRAVELPAILHKKEEGWKAGVADLEQTLAEYQQAAQGDDEQALLDVVEKLHADFEGLMRLIRPPMPELDTYHESLYQVHHHFVPNKQLDELRLEAQKMVTACAALAAAELPRRVQERAAEFEPEFAALCTATTELEAATQGEDWAAIEAAMNLVHDRYVSVEALFE
jgi:hypothetical protein